MCVPDYIYYLMLEEMRQRDILTPDEEPPVQFADGSVEVRPRRKEAQ